VRSAQSIVMSRILLVWELGRHLGHVSRLLSVATRLKARNHSVLAAVRDIPSASTVLGSAEVSFIQCPWQTGVPQTATRMTGYADLLLSQGWNDRSALWGTLQAWITIYRLFRPDVIVLDCQQASNIDQRSASNFDQVFESVSGSSSRLLLMIYPPRAVCRVGGRRFSALVHFRCLNR
jgi:hypothetical protein